MNSSTFEPKYPLTKLNFDLLNEKEKDASDAIAQAIRTGCEPFIGTESKSNADAVNAAGDLIESLGYVSAYLLDDEQLKVTLATQQLVESTRQLRLNGFVCKPYENKQKIYDIVGNEMFEVKGKTDYKGYAQYISWLEPSDEMAQEVAERFFRHGMYHIALFKDNQLQQVIKNVCTFADILEDEPIEGFRVITLIQPKFLAGAIWEPKNLEPTLEALLRFLVDKNVPKIILHPTLLSELLTIAFDDFEPCTKYELFKEGYVGSFRSGTQLEWGAEGHTKLELLEWMKRES